MTKEVKITRLSTAFVNNRVQVFGLIEHEGKIIKPHNRLVEQLAFINANGWTLTNSSEVLETLTMKLGFGS